MPIEDIQYLHQVSERQSYAFLVDSRDRNRSQWPHPEEYVVEFSRPFNNVVGFEIQDAHLPRSMFNIDIYNNSLSFFIYDSSFDINTLNSTHFTKINIDPGDYTIHTLLPELNALMHAVVNGPAANPAATAFIRASSISNPPEVKSRLRFDCPYPFILDMKRSTLAESLGFDLYAVPAETDDYYAFGITQERGWTDADIIETARLLQNGIPEANVEKTMALKAGVSQAAHWVAQAKFFVGNQQMYQSVTKEQVSGETRLIFEGPRAVVLARGGSVAQRFTTTVDTNLTLIEAAFGGSPSAIGQVVNWQLLLDDGMGPDGAQIVFNSAETAAGDSLTVTAINGTFSQSRPFAVRLRSNAVYWIELILPEGVEVYYNDVLFITETTMQVRTESNAWTPIDSPPDVFYQASLRLTATDDFNRVLAPGLFTLMGERYCILRCKEIEENSHRSLAYQKHHLGVAKFNMDTIGYINMLVNERISSSRREFHPIGKLSRLTLRFELPSGKLYLFRGVNHSLMISVTYLEPKMNMHQFQNFSLNEHYNPNFMAYKYGDEPDDQEDATDPHAYRAIEERFRPGEPADLPMHRFRDAEEQQQAWLRSRWPERTSAPTQQNPPPPPPWT
jgi:hypothetical protein